MAPVSERSRTINAAVGALTGLKLLLNGAYRFVYPLLPALGRGLGVGLDQMGVLLSVRWIVTFSMPWVVGAVDKSRRSRRLLVAGLVVFGLGGLVTAVSGVFAGALVGFALMGLGKPIFDIGSQTYVAERIPYRRRARFLGLLELSWAGGLLVGAPFAGWLIDRWGWQVPFWVLGTMVLLSLGVVLLLLDPSDSAAVETSGGVDQPRPTVISFLSVVMMVGFSLELVLVALGAWLEDDFALTVLGLAAVGSLLGVAELGGEGLMVSFTDRLGKRNSYALGMGLAAVALVFLALGNHSRLPGIAALLGMTLCVEFAIISGIPLASELRPNNRPRFLAWFLVASGVGRVVADLIGPHLYQHGGMTLIAIVAAVGAATCTVVLLTRVREVEAMDIAVDPAH